MSDPTPYFGPTGEFPDGKIDPSDKGELQMGIAADHRAGIVRIEFGTPTTWLGLPAHTARSLGYTLIQKANELERGGR
jgi:hypothetical protein